MLIKYLDKMWIFHLKFIYKATIRGCWTVLEGVIEYEWGHSADVKCSFLNFSFSDELHGYNACVDLVDCHGS